MKNLAEVYLPPQDREAARDVTNVTKVPTPPGLRFRIGIHQNIDLPMEARDGEHAAKGVEAGRLVYAAGRYRRGRS